MKILFVCWANVGRSQMAAALYNKMTGTHDADSAGTEVMHPGRTLRERRDRRGGTYVIEAMQAEGIDVTQNIRTQLTKSMLDNYDLIVNMAQPEYTPSWLSGHPRYVYWAINDPGDNGQETAFRVKNRIKAKIEQLIHPPVVVVDEHDNEMGSAALTEVWQKGLYHRVVSIFVEDDLGRMLLQLRGPQVKVYPNCWDQAAGGHVDEGHSYEQTAALELAEETGLHNVALTTLATFRYNEQYKDRIMNQFVRVYSAHVPHDAILQPQANEVSTLQWFTPAELKVMITQHPENFTPGFLHDLRAFFPNVSA